MLRFLNSFLKELVGAVAVLAVLVVFAVAVYAFQEPASGPPAGGSVVAPVNTGATAQTKSGNFTSSGTVTGNILNATMQVSSPQYCIGASCIVSWPAGGGSGTVTSVGTNNGLIGGTITTSGTLGLNTTGGLLTCTNSTTNKLYWNGTALACGTDQTGGGGTGQYDNIHWLVLSRINYLSQPVGTSLIAPVPNNWSIATVQSWARSIADAFGFRVVYEFDRLLPNQATIQGSTGATCSGFPATNPPCRYISESYGIDKGTWVMDGQYMSLNQSVRLSSTFDTAQFFVGDTSSATGWGAFGYAANGNAGAFIKSGGVSGANPLTISASRVNISGNVGIGTTNPGVKLQIDSNTYGLRLKNTGNAGYWQLGPDSSNAFIIANQTNVGVYVPNGGTSWSAYSDISMKENVLTIPDALEKVLQMRGVVYNLKGGSLRELGVIAQEVQSYFPELVNTGPSGYLGVSYDRIAPVLIEAIKEQQKEINSLKARIDTLENR